MKLSPRLRNAVIVTSLLGTLAARDVGCSGRSLLCAGTNLVITDRFCPLCGNETCDVDVETGHRSIAFCHLTIIARWIGRELTFDPATERFIDASDANAWNDRPRRPGYELPEV